ncbi:hypothetical protein H4218_003006 [Coemansia sp. IMI 209128]|nr:hypothetical protein H4218_003006 [Coemansia sp. IMI 209128]
MFIVCRVVEEPRIQIDLEEHWRSFIYGGTLAPTVYSALTDLRLVVSNLLHQTMWAAIEDIVPFPALTNLAADGGYPFSDDLLFRGNGASLKNLGLLFSAIAWNKLGRFGVFRRSGVAQMHSINIGSEMAVGKRICG